MAEQQLESLAGAFRESLKTVEERTQSFIKDAILSGQYKPGERLRQGEIAALLGVSRMPVRASLRKLEAEGLVEIRPNFGAVVCSLRPEQIAEIYELRILLETYLLRHAGARLTPERLDEIAKKLTPEDPDDPTSASWSRRHSFYHELYELAQRPRALEMADRLRLAVGRYFLQTRIDEYRDAHVRLLKKLQISDIEGAAQILETHLNRVSVKLQKIVAGDAEID